MELINKTTLPTKQRGDGLSNAGDEDRPAAAEAGGFRLMPVFQVLAARRRLSGGSRRERRVPPRGLCAGERRVVPAGARREDVRPPRASVRHRILARRRAPPTGRGFPFATRAWLC